MSLMNRLGNSKNPFQGHFKKVLCVCSAGLLRSPTAAFVLSQEPYNYNTRAAGLNDEFALVVVDDVLLNWADEIVCMDAKQEKEIQDRLKHLDITTNVINLKIADAFAYREPDLINTIKKSYKEKSEL